MALMTFKELVKKTVPDFIGRLGETATYNSDAGGPYEVKIIFSVAYETVNVYSGEVESAAPHAIMATVDTDGIKHGATITIDEQIYYIRGIQPDGQGFTTLILSKD